MRRGRPRDPYRAAVAALQADIVDHQRHIVETQALIEQLNARAGIEDSTGGTHRAVQAVHEKPAPKHRRRRRNSSGGTVPRHSAQRRRQKPVVEPTQVAASNDVVAARNNVEPTKAARGAALYKPQYQELERLAFGISEAGDNAEVATKLRLRADAVGRSMGGRGTYPPFFTKSERMRCRRLADAAAKVPETEAPKKKRKASRKAPPPVPPRKVDSGWHDDGAGNLVREIASH